MKTFAVNLPDDLAAFVDAAVERGVFPSTDALFAHAVALACNPEPALPKTESGVIRAVDLTRQNFDSAAFVAGLVDKIHRKKLTQPPPGS